MPALLKDRTLPHRIRMIAIETKNQIHRRTLLKAASVLTDAVEWSASKNGCVQPLPDRRMTAPRLLDTLEGRRELWRLPSGAYKFCHEGVSPNSKKAEFLGLFDLGATVEDVLEAIE